MKTRRILAAALSISMVLLAGCGTKTETAESSSAAPVQETFGIIPDSAPELAPQVEASEVEPDSSVDTEEPQSIAESAAEPEITPPQQPEETVAPEFQWKTAAPEDYGLSASVIDDLHSRYPSLPVLSAVIYRDGHLLDEYYTDGYDENSTFILNSASKSVTSALIGIAIDQGLIESVDTPIATYFPQLQSSADPRAQEITIRHLLTHTPGFSSTDDDNWNSWRSSNNWVDYVLSQPITAQPGTTFRYFTGNTHLLSTILQQVSGMTAYEFAMEYLFRPLGIEDVTCDADPQGISDGGNGFHLSARDMVKLGQLFLDGGVYQGRQIISSQWIAESTSLQFQRNSGSANYGYQWWVRTFGDSAYPAFFAQGHAGQYIFVVPALSLVVTMTSDYEGPTSVYWEFVNEIVNAMG